MRNRYVSVVILMMALLSTFDGSAQLNLAWAKSIGSGGTDEAQAIVADANGNVYVAGSFNGTVDFDPGVGTFTLVSAGATDGYVAKYDVSGNFIDAISFTNNLDCKAYSLALDNLGNIIVTGGFTGSVDFEPGPGVTQLVAGGYYDIFLVKLTTNLGFVWAHRFGYTGGDDYGYSVSTDSGNNILVTGYFQGTNIDFDPGGPTYYISSQGLKDVFVLKLDQNASFLWAFGLGAPGAFQEVAQVIKTDAFDNVIIGGYFYSNVDFDPSAGTQTLSASGNSDAFVAKYTSAGAYVWAGAISGIGAEVCYGLQPDLSGNIYCTGTFAGGTSCDFDPGTSSFTLQSNGIDQDIFLTKISSAGNFVWAKAMGGNLPDFGRGVAVDANKVYLSGYFNGVADLNPSATVNSFTSNGGLDFFVTSLDLSGNYINAFSYGALGNDYCNAIFCTTTGVLHVAGSFSNTVDFDAGVGTTTLVSAGGLDAYFFKLQDVSVHIEEVDKEDILRIYPNPVVNEVTIQSKDQLQIAIFNSSGIEVYSDFTSGSDLSIPFQEYPRGIYIFRVTTNTQVIYRKVVKE